MAQFLPLIDEQNPDIVCGCESHLDSSYHTAEIFPETYNVFRKDRIVGGGGVFIFVKKEINVVEELSLNVDAEIIWIKIMLTSQVLIYVCSYYRLPNAESHSIPQLQASLTKLLSYSNNPSHIILTGDFNLPSINWIDGYGQLGTNTPHLYGTSLNNLFLNAINDAYLEQFVTSPTQQNNILDLVFSTHHKISNLSTVPSMSDHEALAFHLDLSQKPSQAITQHNIALYYKANIAQIKDLLIFQQIFFLSSNSLSRSVDQNWQELKQAISDVVLKHVPHRTVRTRNCLPWIAKPIKKDMKKRKLLYNKAKTSNFHGDREAYRRVKNEINVKLKAAHNTYVLQ